MNFKDWKDWFICQRNRLGKGTSLIYDPKNILQIVVLGAMYVKMFFGIDLSLPLQAIAGILMLLALWGVGYVWDKIRMYDVEAEWSNKRNPFVKEMRDKIK